MIEYRRYNDDDKNFVMNSWLKDLQEYKTGEYVSTHSQKRLIIKQGFFGSFMPHDLFYKRFRPIVERTFDKSEIIVACNPEHKDQIYGYIVSRKLSPELTVISFCYVKLPFRRMGIARNLFETVKSNTNVTTVYVPWLDKIYKKQGIIFDPFFDIEE